MNFDVCVIGTGPAGYVAAIRAAQLGLKTVSVEKYTHLGGTCLNVGCIPSKALLQSSEHFHEARSSLTNHGVEVTPKLNLATMMARKSKVVADLTQGVAHLLKKNKVSHVQGSAQLLGDGKLLVKSKQNQEILAKHIIIATGSKPTELPHLKFDDQTIVSSTGALAFDKVPERLLVVGGGAIGLELGSVWQRLGAQVTVVEFLDRILATMDGAVSREMKRVLSRQGMKFQLSTRVIGAEIKQGKVQVRAINKQDKELNFEADKVLVSVGRNPYFQGLGLEQAGVRTDKAGRVIIDHKFETTAAGVYAIGDVVRGPMLAHKAEEEGMACAELIAGKPGHVNYETIPNIVYTRPEVATVGKTEAALKQESITFKTGKCSFKGNARARCMGSTDGFVKILAHSQTDRILGVHIVGANASELIAEAVLAMEYSASAEDLARTVHAHPSLSEAIKEAMLDVDGRALHS